MDPVLQGLIKKFRTLDDESQKNIIRRLEKKDPEAADLLKKVRKMQKRGDKIKNVADKIIDKLE